LLRRPVVYVAGVVVGLGAFAVGLPWWAAVAVGVLALLAGAGLAALLFGFAARPPGAHMPAPPAPVSPTAEFRLEGEYWTLAFRGPPFRLADSKGLRYIHRLLETPGVEVYALDLEIGPHAAPATIVPDEEGVHSDPPTRQDIVDQPALKAYRTRIEELRVELEEADRNNDPERASQAREELEFLLDEVSNVTRPGGGPAKVRDETERARVNVTRVIKSAIQKIREQDPSLGHHLDHDIRTGTYCVYQPDPATSPDWVL
jgi:hypothetical protein